ncbi:MAG: DUF1810 domain-containing protein [Bacteroidota bacterium]|nr:DUF1810 domain-containing protein [Bacteroidota bacterium]MDP4251925.1 DUF1810 domain-containing protein [Bacteroidota bacterium]
MSAESGLKRFIDAWHSGYATALSEIKRGRKVSHWMWYVFPQIQGLGFSETSKYYAIRNVPEAQAFLNHPVLGPGLIGICQALLDLGTSDAGGIFGSPDDLKLKSSMTLFVSIPDTNPIFQKVLDQFFNGTMDSRTLEIIGTQPSFNN